MSTVAALRALVRPHRTPIALGTMLVLAASLLGLVQPLASRDILEALDTGASVTRPLVSLAVLVVTSAAAVAAGFYLLTRTAEAVVLAGRQNLVHRMLRLTLPAMRSQSPGDLLSRVTTDTSVLRQVSTTAVVQGVTGSVTLIGAMVLMAYLDWLLLLITLGVVCLLAAVLGVVLPRIRQASRGAQNAVGQLGGSLERALGTFTTVKVSGAEDAETQRINASARRAYDEGVALAKWGSLAGTVSGLAIQVALLVVLGVGGARVVSGSTSAATLIAFLLYVLYIAQPLGQLVSMGTYIQVGRASIARINDINRMPMDPLEAEVEPRAGVLGSAATLRFEEVTFTHQGREDPSLHHVSFEVPLSGLTAIVGSSGSGKTTILNMVERFFDPQQGVVTLGGMDLQRWHLPTLRSRIGFVEQDPAVMAGTLRENLTFAAPDVDERQLRDVLAITRLGPLLERLGGDLDAPVQYRGTSLSGGERQRVAIARVLLRNPSLLLLDEPTSQLDAVNEGALREVISNLADRTGVIVVAHRLSTVRSAHRIILMDNGRVRAIGTHDELVNSDSLYASLAKGQLLAGPVSAPNGRNRTVTRQPSS